MWNFIMATLTKFIIMLNRIILFDSTSLLDIFIGFIFVNFLLYFILSLIKFGMGTTSSSINNDVKDTFTSLHDSLSEQRTRL